MRPITQLSSSLLMLSAFARGDPTWPSVNDELEEIMYQVKGFQNRGFGGTVIPCSSEASGPGRQNAAEWLRTGFHDMATRSTNFGRGGLDGSLQYEVGRGENTGPGFRTTLKFMSDYYSTRSSVADLIALGVYYSVRSCGGPAIPVRGGRIDATAAGDMGVPQPENSVFSFQQRFLGMGFDSTEMIQMTACGHTLGGVHTSEFPNIAPANSLNGEASLDSTVAAFDNRIITEYLANTTTNPLVIGQSQTNGRNSDARVFASDGNATVQAMSDPTAFQSVCKAVLQRMIDAVPPGVVLTDPIAPYYVKPVGLQLTLEGGATMMTLGGMIRVRTTGLAAAPSSVTILYKDRNGGSDCMLAGCAYTISQQGVSSGFDDTFAWYQFGGGFRVTTSAGISSFTITVNFDDGTKQTFDNNGASYRVQDGILLQKPQSCLLQTTGALTVTAAVRNDRSALPVSLIVYKKTGSDSNPVATLSNATTPMVKGACVGAYTLYTANYQIPDARLSYSAKLDVVSGTGSDVTQDDFNRATELAGSCDDFSAPPTSLCTTGQVGTRSSVSSISSTSMSVISSTSSTKLSSTTITSKSSQTSTSSSSSTSATGPAQKQSLGTYQLLGCKKEPSTARALAAARYAYNGMTLESCMKNCTGYNYWGTEYGRECYCGNSIDSGSEDAAITDCNMPCSGDVTEYCGAGNRIEVYVTTVTPTASLAREPTVSPYARLGCFTEVSGRALTGARYADNSMTLELCASKCSGFSYFAAEYSRECYCGNTLDVRSTIVADGECNMVCAGNHYEYCGGSNRMELYGVSKITPSSSGTSITAASSSTTSTTLRISSSTTLQSSPTTVSTSTLTPSQTSSKTTSTTTPGISSQTSGSITTTTSTSSSARPTSSISSSPLPSTATTSVLPSITGTGSSSSSSSTGTATTVWRWC
ncbi:hypothetical protein E8E14_012464 [Neopestalotiopsis sp. 37M]|nr:hypothetical protein E8E14_012464 [Neopestalotiopsis sp. 37M]